MQVPDTDTSEFAALMDFVATSGRSRPHPVIEDKADELVAEMWSSRARAMTQSLTAMAKAALHGKR